MSRVMVVSIGPGNVDYISQKAKERLEQSDFVLGSRRQIEDVRRICSVTTEFYVYKKIT